MKVTAQRGVGQDKVALLVQRLASTVKALESLLADERDSVVCPDGESFLLPRAGVATIDALLRVNANLKIIVVTGFVTEAQKEAAMLAGASEFLAKPFTIEKLLATLRTVLRSPAALTNP